MVNLRQIWSHSKSCLKSLSKVQRLRPKRNEWAKETKINFSGLRFAFAAGVTTETFQLQKTIPEARFQWQLLQIDCDFVVKRNRFVVGVYF